MDGPLQHEYFFVLIGNPKGLSLQDILKIKLQISYVNNIHVYNHNNKNHFSVYQ